MKKSLVAIINEFGPDSAPVGDLADDLYQYLRGLKRIKAYSYWISKTYTPGGLKLRRLFNAAFMYVSIPFYFAFLKIEALLSERTCTAIVITTPPLLHWVCIVFGKLMGVRVIVWYQDAHPHFSIKSFRKKGHPVLARGLAWIDRLLGNQAEGYITLDASMKVHLQTSRVKEEKIKIATPWITYLHPPRSIHLPRDSNKLKLIYAGNYGEAHDLSALTSTLAKLDEKEQQAFEFHFLGLNQSAQEAIKALFSGLKVAPIFHGRLEHREDVGPFLRKFDLGIVSLKDDYFGYACPSKAYSYLSQGLPLLYIGKPGTLSQDLVNRGYGINLSLEFLKDPRNLLDRFRGIEGTLFEDPKRASQELIADWL